MSEARLAHPGDVAVSGDSAAVPMTSLGRIEGILGLLVEIPAALLVVAEIVILFAGVVSRYVFHSPLIWSDELASILFLWLAMFGAVVAFRRAEHMRMTAVVAKCSPADACVSRGCRHLRCAGLSPDDCSFLPTNMRMRKASSPRPRCRSRIRGAHRRCPSASASWCCLPCCGSRASRTRSACCWRSCTVGAIIAAFWFMQPVLRPLGNLNLVIFFVGVVALCVFAGVPIAFAFGLSIFSYLVLTTHTPPMVLVGRMDEGMSHLILLAVPLFVFLGLLIEMTGMARAMVAFLASLLGHVKGGLHYVLIGAMYLVSGISGSKAADMAAVAPVLFPEMKERGAKPGDLVALLSATGAQTETIPPSLVLITIGSVTGVSIAALFTGGLLPGLVLAATLSGAGVVALSRRRPQPRRARDAEADSPHLRHRASGARAALRDPRRSGGRHCDRDGSLHHRHRVRDLRRSPDLSSVRLGQADPDADRDGVSLGRDPVDHRHSHRHGVGAHAIRLLARAGIR